MIVKKNIHFGLKYFPALISGLLITLSFPDTGFSFLVFFALVPLLVSIKQMTCKGSFWAGFITGFVYFSTLLYWIVPTMNLYGGLHLILAVSVLVLFCMYLALYSAVFALALKKLESGDQPYLKSYFIPLFAGSLWVALEYIKTYAFTGFPWGSLGYSQFTNLPLIQIADFSGIYGVSFLIVLSNCSFAGIWIMYKTKYKKKYIIPVIYTFVLFMGAYIYGNFQMNSIDLQIQSAQKIKISIIQGNIKQDLKWSNKFKQNTIEKYIKLSKEQFNENPDLVIWPETALPFYYKLEKDLSQKIDQCVQSSKTNFLVGSPAVEPDGENVKFYNRAYMLDQFSNVKGIWDKHHLVPFGEYVPFGKYLTFLGKLTAQAGNFSPGMQDFEPLEFNANTLDEIDALQSKHKIGVLICFEIMFPSIASNFVKNSADILTTITNDAWFGYSSAAIQHFSIAVFRAVENRRSMARAANTGISGFIDPKGEIIETTSLFIDSAVSRQVPVLSHLSFYTKYGDVFAISCTLLLLIICMRKLFK